MYKIQCALCGNEIEAKNKNTKYCPACRTRANTLNKRKQRAKDKEAYTEVRASENKSIVENWEKENLKNRKRLEDELEASAQRGNVLAKMRLAFRNGCYSNREYWHWFKRYEIEFAGTSGKQSKCTVNGISVLLDDFEDLVLDSIAVMGHIFIDNE